MLSYQRNLGISEEKDQKDVSSVEETSAVVTEPFLDNVGPSNDVESFSDNPLTHEEADKEEHAKPSEDQKESFAETLELKTSLVDVNGDDRYPGDLDDAINEASA